MAQSVRNIKELRAKKAELKKKMEAGLDNPFDNIKGMIQSYTSNNENPLAILEATDIEKNQLMDEGVKAVLTLAASTAVTRFKLGSVPKMLLIAGVAIATPYVVDKIQKTFSEK